MQLQNRLRDRVTVLAISMDMDQNAYYNFIRDHKVDLLTVRDPAQKSSALYGTYKFPETYLIDRPRRDSPQYHPPP